MEQKQGQCDSCQRDDKISPATVFCLQCCERLCEQCKKHHKMNKASSSHKTMSITDVKDVEALNTLKRLTQCPVHQAKSIKYLCKDHDQLCCNECAIVRHRKCESVVSLAEEMESTSGERSQSTEEVLKGLANHADLLLRHEETDQVQIESTKEDCVEALATLKKNMDDAYKVLAYKLTEEAKMGRDNLTRKIAGQKVDIEAYKKDVNESIQKLETVKRVGQDIHVYLAEREMHLEVKAFKKKIKGLHEHANNKKLVIHERSSKNAIERSLKSFVNVHVMTVNPSLPVCTVKGMFETFPTKRQEFPLELHKETQNRARKQTLYTFLQTGVKIHRCVWLHNVLVVLRNKTDIVLIDTDGELTLTETDLEYDYQPIITKVNDKSLALALATANATKIILMKLDSTRKVLQRNRQFSVRRKLIGMACDTGIEALIAVSNSGIVQFLNLDGTEMVIFTLNRIQNMPEYVDNVVTMFDSDFKILYTADKSSLIGTGMDGSQVFEYKLTESLVASPALDEDGNIYIPRHTGDTSVIQQVSRKGELIRTIPISACALKYMMVCFNTKMDKMIVLCDEKDKELKRFDIVS